MKRLEKFTEEEWTLLATTPQLVGMAMAGVGSSGLVGSTKEMFANARSLMQAKKDYAGNELIQAILPDTTDRQKAMEDAKVQRDTMMTRFKTEGIKKPEDLARVVLEDCAKAIDILEEKEPETVESYKAWLLEVAENVANAAKEGGFLGFGGVQFSEKEQELFHKLKNALV